MSKPIKKGTHVSWKVAGYPDAVGVAHSDENSDGLVVVDTRDEESGEGGLIYMRAADLTVLVLP